MKYKGLSKIERERYQLPLLDGGINTYLDPCAISENQSTDLKNVWFKNGMLRSRPGMVVQPKSIKQRNKVFSIKEKLKFTDVDVTYGGDQYKLAYTLVSDYITHEELCTYLVDKEGSMLDIEPLVFSRITENEFMRFSNVVFLAGKQTKHSGIYAFLTRYCVNYGYLYHVYELSLENFNWERLEETDFYTPVTYMYGRGNNYEKAVEMNRAVEEKPVSPEGYNMLSGYFKAYYSSDEYSNEFVLPARNIKADTPVECRVYYNPYSYARWRIPASENSVVSTIYSTSITMVCDRKNGIINFKYDDGTDFSIPKMRNARENNIVFTACRSTDMKERIMLNKKAVVYNSNFFLCGNEKYPNEVYCAPVDNPLYFAENMKTSVGKYGSEVVGIAVQQNKLIAFKKDEIYKINITDKNTSSLQLLYDNEYDFSAGNRLTTTPIHLEIGCIAPNSIALCGNKLVWVGKGGKIYTLITTTYGKENNVYEVSLPINRVIEGLNSRELGDAFAVEHNGYYMVCIDKNVFLMDYKIKNFGVSTTFTGLKDTADSISWYRWSFPHEADFTTFSEIGGNLLIGCKIDKVFYMALLEGNKDTAVQSDGQTIKEYPISAFFFTGNMPPKDLEQLKNIDEVYIECSNSSHIDLEIVDKNQPLSFLIEPSEEITLRRVNSRIRAASCVNLKISSAGEFAVGRIIISYHNISKVR